MSSVVDDLVAALGAERVRTGEQIPPRNWADASGLEPVRPRALVLPASTEEVATALAICHRHGQPLVIQGGLTGLAGGARPQAGEIALSLERMVGIEEIDRASNTLTALAGTPLQVVQQAADEVGLTCGIDLGARGSCTIGGNVATNAGGNQVLRYGMTRKNVLGLEVVLPDGRIVRSLNKMMKNNTGYDWTQLLIGSEGTLGVITRVVLALQPKPRGIQTALLAVDATADGHAVLRRLEGMLPMGLLVFEAMWAEFYEIATATIGVPAALEAGRELYLLVEAPLGDGDPAQFENALAELFEAGLVRDAVIAKSGAERERLWALRESAYEYGRHFPHSVTFDISIPMDRTEEAIARFRRDIPAAFPQARWVAFGHIADSNMHLDVMPPELTPVIKRAIEELVYGHTAALGGSISAEHGIGTAKRPYLAQSRSAPELALMATIKEAIDPTAILNRGRVL